RSMPIVSNPFAASNAASGAPSLPNPITATRFVGASGRVKSGCLRRHKEMPAQTVLEPTKDALRHQAEVPGADVAMLDIVCDAVGENMVDGCSLDAKALAFEQAAQFRRAINVGDGTPSLRLGVARDDLGPAPEAASAI